jgi:flagellar motor switch protein FliG
MLQLSTIDAGEREQIINEFIHNGPPSPAVDSSGVELAGSLADEISSIEHPSADAGEHQVNPPRFAFLKDASSGKLAQFLASEHPQTVSIVLAHLPPRRAADVLTRFAPKFQTEVLGRLARLDEADVDVVCEVGQELEKLLRHAFRASQKRPRGLAAVEAILDAAVGGDRETLLARMEACDRRLTRQLGYAYQTRDREANLRQEGGLPSEEGGREHAGPVFQRAPVGTATSGKLGNLPHVSSEHALVADPTKSLDSASTLDFNDLIALDDVALAKVFRAADPEMTLLALTGASQQMVDRILRRLPFREAKTFRRQMEQLGPTRLSDLEQAQQQLAELAGQMADQGDILVPKYRRFTAAA